MPESYSCSAVGLEAAGSCLSIPPSPSWSWLVHQGPPIHRSLFTETAVEGPNSY